MECTTEGLFETFNGKLREFILSKTRDQNIADDILQETFVKIIRHCDKGKTCNFPKSFLYQTAMSAIVDYYRSSDAKMSRNSVPLDFWDGTGLERDLTSHNTNDDQEKKELAECLITLVNSLPQPYRDAVILADIKNLPQKEIADKLGISLSGAKSRVQRGRGKLKDLLIKICDTDGNSGIADCWPR